MTPRACLPAPRVSFTFAGGECHGEVAGSSQGELKPVLDGGPGLTGTRGVASRSFEESLGAVLRTTSFRGGPELDGFLTREAIAHDIEDGKDAGKGLKDLRKCFESIVTEDKNPLIKTD